MNTDLTEKICEEIDVMKTLLDKIDEFIEKMKLEAAAG